MECTSSGGTTVTGKNEKSAFNKSKMCSKYINGSCTLGKDCKLAHPTRKVCPSYVMRGSCKNERSCKFLHGDKDNVKKHAMGGKRASSISHEDSIYEELRKFSYSFTLGKKSSKALVRKSRLTAMEKEAKEKGTAIKNRSLSTQTSNVDEGTNKTNARDQQSNVAKPVLISDDQSKSLKRNLKNVAETDEYRPRSRQCLSYCPVDMNEKGDSNNNEAIGRFLGISSTKSDDMSRSSSLKTDLQNYTTKDEYRPKHRQCLVDEDASNMEAIDRFLGINPPTKSTSDLDFDDVNNGENNFRPFAIKPQFTCVVEDEMESSSRISEVESLSNTTSEQAALSDRNYEEEFRPFASNITLPSLSNADEENSNTETLNSLLREIAISSTQKDQILSLVGAMEKDVQQQTRKRGVFVLIKDRCLHYMISGWCGKRNTCKLSHDLSMANQRIWFLPKKRGNTHRCLQYGNAHRCLHISQVSANSDLPNNEQKFHPVSTKDRCPNYMIRGVCKFGNDCKLSHGISIANMKVCYTFNNDGRCKNGRSCKNLHALIENKNPKTCNNKKSPSPSSVDENANNMEAIDRFLGINPPTKSDGKSSSSNLKTDLLKDVRKDQSHPISRQCMSFTVTGRCRHTNNKNFSHNLSVVGNKIRYFCGKKGNTPRYLHIFEVESTSNIDCQSSSKIDPRLQNASSKGKYRILSTEGHCLNYMIDGECKFWEKCKYSHDITIANMKVCHTFNNDGSCKNGRSCKNLHVLEENVKDAIRDKLKSPSPSSVDEDANNMEAIDRFLGINPPTKFEEQSGSIEVNTNPIRRQCVHYMMRGAETHNENCNYSHDLLMENGKICFKNDENDGNPQKYLHIAEVRLYQNLDKENTSSPSNEDISINGQSDDQSSNSMNLQTANRYRLLTTVGRCMNHLIRGTCKFGESCTYLHDITIANMEVCHTFNNDGSCKNGRSCKNLHALVETKTEMEPCAICLEKMSEKPVEKRIFGILQNCNHVFCVECIKKWRKTSSSCPYCRANSNFVLHSKKWIEDKKEKENAIKKRKNNWDKHWVKSTCLSSQ